jgi:hypothetical protein
MAEQKFEPHAANMRLRKMLEGVGQGGELIPMQKLAVAAWNFIVTVATTRRGVKAETPETANEEESAEQQASASGGLGGPDPAPTPLGPTPMPFPSSLAQEQAALRAAVAERQGQAEGNQGESLEQEFERVAESFRQAQEAQGESPPPMENDVHAVVAGAIQEELGGGLPPAAANDNYSSTARNIALPPGRGNGDNDNGGSGADGASQQPEDDLVMRLEEIAVVAEQEGPDSLSALEKMQDLLRDCQQPEKMNKLFVTAAQMQNHYLDAVVGVACLEHIERAAASNE